MAETPQKEQHRDLVRVNHTGAFVTIFMLLALLFVSNLYTLGKLNSSRSALKWLRQDLHGEIEDLRNADGQLSAKFSLLEDRDAREIEALRQELDTAAGRLGSSSGQVLDRARLMVAQLQRDQRRQVGELQQQIARKANSDDIDSLDEDVSSAKARLGSAQRTMNVLAGDLGMARSELGTLLERDRNDIAALRQDAGREYVPFSLTRNAKQNVAGIGLILRKTHNGQHRFTLDLIVNDRQIRNEKQNVGQPIVFYVEGVKTPCELVVNEISGETAKGFLSVPKELGSLGASGRPANSQLQDVY